MAVCLAAVGWVLWEQDGRYARPAPVPAGYRPISAGTHLPLATLLPEVPVRAGDGSTVLVHFYNPGCPCSRFNAEHVLALRREFSGKLRLIVSVQGAAGERDAALRKAGRDFPGAELVFDEGGQIAARCGVYSTPQAVILSPAGDLLYRGNYNVSRYCADPATEFARLVLAQTLAGHAVPPLPAAATEAWGCELPTVASETRTAATGFWK